MSGPLSGVRILDLSSAYTGPFATALLADQGADVIKVERPGVGDMTRWMGVVVNGVSSLYQLGNRGKRSVVIDLQSPDGVESIRRLAPTVDVVVQNFRPGVVERLHVGYDDLVELNPDLVYVSISGFGDEGPHRERPAMDGVMQAFAGFAVNEADADGQPRFLHQAAIDKITALFAAQAITAALFARATGAGGQHVRLSMLDATVSYLWPDCAGNETLTESDRSQPSRLAATVQPIRCQDGWVISVMATRRMLLDACRALGVAGTDDPRLASDDVWRSARELTSRLYADCSAALAGLTVADAVARLGEAGVPCAAVQSLGDLVHDEHVETIGVFVEDVHPDAGRIRQPRHPILFERTPARVGGPAPALGQHTDEVLGAVSGDADGNEHEETTT